jgi:hypothetical protein
MGLETDSNVDKATNKQAPTDFVSLAQPYNLEIVQTYPTTAYDHQLELGLWVKSHLTGMSQVMLIELIVTYKATGSGQTLKAGFSHTNSTYSIDQVSMRKGGINFTANSITFGTKMESELVVPQTFTTQIQPYDPHRPACKFYLQKSDGMDLSLIWRLKFADYIVIHEKVET